MSVLRACPRCCLFGYYVCMSLDRFVQDCLSFCGGYIAGPKGTGKTCLAVAVAARLRSLRVSRDDLRNSQYDFSYFPDDPPRYRVFSNIHFSLNCAYTPDLLESIHHSCILIDEAGSRWAGARTWNSKEQNSGLSVVDYARKQRLIFLTPSASAVDKKLRELQVVRNMTAKRFLDFFGFTSLFHFVVKPLGQDSYTFFLDAKKYFPLYDTNEIPSSEGDALYFLLQEFQKHVAYNADAARQAAQKFVDTLGSGVPISPLLYQPSRVRSYPPLWLFLFLERVSFPLYVRYLRWVGYETFS